MNPWLAALASLVILALFQVGGTKFLIWLGGSQRKH